MKAYIEQRKNTTQQAKTGRTVNTSAARTPNSTMLAMLGEHPGARMDLSQAMDLRMQERFGVSLSGIQGFKGEGPAEPGEPFSSRNQPRPVRDHNPAAGGRSLTLPREVKEDMERAIGRDFSKVKFVESPSALEMGESAYTQGDTAVFAPGVFSPRTDSGKKTIAHELTHVVQQAQGRATVKDGKPYDDSASLEQEAKTTAQSALSGTESHGMIAPLTPASADAAPMQGEGGFFQKRKARKAAERQRQEEARREEELRKAVKPKEAHDLMVAMTRKRDIENLDKTGQAAQNAVVMANGLYSDNPDIEANKLIHNESMLDPKMFRKSMTNMWDMATSYNKESNVRVGEVNFFDDADSGENAHALVNDSKIEFNQAKYLRSDPIPKGAARKAREIAGKAGDKYAWFAANRNYTGTHEMGHIVNRALIEKIRGNKNIKDDQGEYNDIWSDEWSSHATSANVVTDSIRDVYEKDETFRNKFNAKAGVVEGDTDEIRKGKIEARLSRTDQAAGRKKRYLEDPRIRNATDGHVNTFRTKPENAGLSDEQLRDKVMKLMGPNAQDDIYRDMYELGYTSQYGASTPGEFLAEAHADEIRIQKKKNKGKMGVENNPLSSAIVSKSRELLAEGQAGDAARDAFRLSHAQNYPPQLPAAPKPVVHKPILRKPVARKPIAP